LRMRRADDLVARDVAARFAIDCVAVDTLDDVADGEASFRCGEIRKYRLDHASVLLSALVARPAYRRADTGDDRWLFAPRTAAGARQPRLPRPNPLLVARGPVPQPPVRTSQQSELHDRHVPCLPCRIFERGYKDA